MTAQPAPGDGFPPIPAPMNDKDLDALLKRLGETSRALTIVEEQGNRRIARAKQLAQNAKQPLEAEQEALAKVIVAYAKANRKAMTEGGTRQSAEFTFGKLSWRKSGVGSLIVASEKALIAALRARRGGRKFLVVKESVDANALKKEMAKNPRLRRFLTGSGLARVKFSESLTIETKPSSRLRKQLKPFKETYELD